MGFPCQDIELGFNIPRLRVPPGKSIATGQGWVFEIDRYQVQSINAGRQNFSAKNNAYTWFFVINLKNKHLVASTKAIRFITVSLFHDNAQDGRKKTFLD